MDRTEYRVKLIKRIKELDKQTGFIGRHGIECTTEKMLEEFVRKYEEKVQTRRGQE